jgi:hypothetical protein
MMALAVTNVRTIWCRIGWHDFSTWDGPVGPRWWEPATEEDHDFFSWHALGATTREDGVVVIDNWYQRWCFDCGEVQKHNRRCVRFPVAIALSLGAITAEEASHLETLPPNAEDRRFLRRIELWCRLGLHRLIRPRSLYPDHPPLPRNVCPRCRQVWVGDWRLLAVRASMKWRKLLGNAAALVR